MNLKRKIFFLVWVLFMVSVFCGPVAGFEWKVGDVLLVRNPVVNIIPGHWNHVAMYVGVCEYGGPEYVIEAPGYFHVVQLTPLKTILNDCPDIAVYRLKNEYQHVARKMVQYAMLNLAGKSYTILGWDKWGKEGYSCVMLVRFSYAHATGSTQDPGWIRPDAFKKDYRFYLVGGKGDFHR